MLCRTYQRLEDGILDKPDKTIRGRVSLLMLYVVCAPFSRRSMFFFFYLLKDLCSVSNGGCSHRCTSLGRWKVQCSCPGQMQLKEDGKNCRSGEWGLIIVWSIHPLPLGNKLFGGLGEGYLGSLLESVSYDDPFAL